MASSIIAASNNTGNSTMAEIGRLMCELVKNHNARLATILVTYQDGEQVEVTADSKTEVAA